DIKSAEDEILSRAFLAAFHDAVDETPDKLVPVDGINGGSSNLTSVSSPFGLVFSFGLAAEQSANRKPETPVIGRQKRRRAVCTAPTSPSLDGQTFIAAVFSCRTSIAPAGDPRRPQHPARRGRCDTSHREGPSRVRPGRGRSSAPASCGLRQGYRQSPRSRS